MASSKGISIVGNARRIGLTEHSSPAAGAPEICIVQPLYWIFWPAVKGTFDRIAGADAVDVEWSADC